MHRSVLSVVLELRLYAMYRGIRWATIIIFSLPILESIAVGILFGLPNRSYGSNEPVPGIQMCADGDLSGKRFFVFYPTTSLIIEVTLLSLSLWQLWINRGQAMTHGRIMRMLITGSVFYFLWCVHSISWLQSNIDKSMQPVLDLSNGANILDSQYST